MKKENIQPVKPDKPDTDKPDCPEKITGTEPDRRQEKRRKIAAAVSAVIFLLLAAAVTWLLWQRFFVRHDDPAQFRDWLLSFGIYGRFIAFGIQVLQVIVALLPGEAVEIAAGYAYGYFEGTLICMAGVAAGSSLIFMLTKKFGIRFVGIFTDPEKINRLAFINSEKRLNTLVFLLFFIPGTPKDLLTYFIGLTRMRLGEFLVLTLIARIPSLVSSTVGGHFIGEGNYAAAVTVFAITAVISLCGLYVYSVIIKRKGR